MADPAITPRDDSPAPRTRRALAGEERDGGDNGASRESLQPLQVPELPGTGCKGERFRENLNTSQARGIASCRPHVELRG
jgi:hypothetical protein